MLCNAMGSEEGVYESAQVSVTKVHGSNIICITRGWVGFKFIEKNVM